MITLRNHVTPPLRRMKRRARAASNIAPSHVPEPARRPAPTPTPQAMCSTCSEASKKNSTRPPPHSGACLSCCTCLSSCVTLTRGKKVTCSCSFPCAMDNPCDIGTKAKNRKMRPLLETDASGPFFDDAPMKYFGSTPIAYFAVFGMKDLLEELVGCPKKVEEAQVKAEFAATLLPPAQRSRFNEARDKARDKKKSTFDGAPMPQRMPSPLSEPERYYLVNELRCKCTGYLPIHAVAASDNKVMYDFMVDICGANDKLEVEELSALKLSVVLGKQAMVKHILKRRLVTAWVWGPVIQYMIPLDEIDTAGERLHRDDHLSKKFDQRCLGNMQLLELVVAPNAKEVTRQMMLDSFMNGFFFKVRACTLCTPCTYTACAQTQCVHCMYYLPPSSLRRSGPITQSTGTASTWACTCSSHCSSPTWPRPPSSTRGLWMWWVELRALVIARSYCSRSSCHSSSSRRSSAKSCCGSAYGCSASP